MVWEIVWSIVLGVILGGIVTGGTMLFVEWWKSKRSVNNWTCNLLLEVDRNIVYKTIEIKFLYREIQNCSSININNFLDYINCNFDTFNSLIRSGITLRNKKILPLYSSFIGVEKNFVLLKQSFFNEYLILTNINSKQKKEEKRDVI